MQRHNKLILGIDFGTSKSGLAIFEGRGKARILARSGGDGTAADFPDWAFPTEVVLSTGTADPIVAPLYLSFGGDYDDNYEEVSRRPGLGQIVRTKSLKLRLGEVVSLGTAPHKIDDLIPGFLQYMRKELLSGTDPQNAYVVLGMPAGFEYAKRRALVKAAHVAGFAQVELLPEPIAGLLALSKSKNLRGKHILVIDYGGGTCNYAIMEVDTAGHFRVLCARSVPQGGEDITETLFRKFGPQPPVGSDELKFKIRRILGAAKMNYVPGKPIPNIEPITTVEGAFELSSERMRDPEEGFEATIHGAVSAVRDELERRSRGDDLAAIDEVHFLGESRRLFCFRELFWDRWLCDATKLRTSFGLVEQESQEIEAGTPNGDPFAQSRKLVALGCALHAGSLFGNQKTYLHSKTSWRIIGELLDMDGRPLKLRSVPKVKIPQEIPLPHRVRVDFTLDGEVNGFKVKFTGYEQLPNEVLLSHDMETFVVKPDAHSALEILPKGTEINLVFTIRRDELIEIKSYRAVHLIGKPFFHQLKLEWKSNLEGNS